MYTCSISECWAVVCTYNNTYTACSIVYNVYIFLQVRMFSPCCHIHKNYSFFLLGYQTALRLASQGAHVIMACRDAMKAERAISQIRQSTVCQ